MSEINVENVGITGLEISINIKVASFNLCDIDALADAIARALMKEGMVAIEKVKTLKKAPNDKPI